MHAQYCSPTSTVNKESITAQRSHATLLTTLKGMASVGHICPIRLKQSHTDFQTCDAQIVLNLQTQAEMVPVMPRRPRVALLFDEVDRPLPHVQL